jgi:hypothetical protein
MSQIPIISEAESVVMEVIRRNNPIAAEELDDER